MKNSDRLERVKANCCLVAVMIVTLVLCSIIFAGLWIVIRVAAQML